MASTTLFGKTNRFRLYRYRVQAVQFVIPGDQVIDIPTERVISFGITNNYEKDLYPLFRIAIALEPSRYYKILAAKNDGYLYLRVDNFYTLLDNSTPSRYRKYINGNFSIIHDEGTDDMLAAQKVRENQRDFTSRNRNDVNNLKDTESSIMHLHLFRTDIMDGTKTNISAILADANVTDAIAYCINTAKIYNYVVMAKPDNKKIYKELLIPPLSFNKEIAFIDSYYGLYKSGTLIYFGLENGYIVPFNGRCQAYISEINSTISILIPDSSNQHTSSSGVLYTGSDSDTNAYVVGDFHTMDIQNASISNDYINANSMTIIDSYDGSISSTESQAENRSGVNFSQLQADTTENDFLSTMYAAYTKALSTVIKIRINNVDCSLIEPNKRYTVVFEDANYATKYSGNYIISSSEFTFVREGLDFMVGAVITLKHE